jgi:hypothetical protein
VVGDAFREALPPARFAGDPLAPMVTVRLLRPRGPAGCFGSWLGFRDLPPGTESASLAADGRAVAALFPFGGPGDGDTVADIAFVLLRQNLGVIGNGTVRNGAD